MNRLLSFAPPSQSPLNVGTTKWITTNTSSNWKSVQWSWWCYDIETLFVLYERKILVIGGFRIQRPDSKVHGVNMGPIWGRQDPGGPHVGPMNLAIRAGQLCAILMLHLLLSRTDCKQVVALPVIWDTPMWSTNTYRWHWKPNKLWRTRDKVNAGCIIITDRWTGIVRCRDICKHRDDQVLILKLYWMESIKVI